MNKTELETLVGIRLAEAQALLQHAHFHGAYYLAGYAMECALKACIAKQIQQHDFPNKKLADDSYSHDLSRLIGVAGLKQALARQEKSDPEFSLNWAIVKDWSEQARYESQIKENQAQDLLRALVTPESGVLPWLKTYW